MTKGYIAGIPGTGGAGGVVIEGTPEDNEVLTFNSLTGNLQSSGGVTAENGSLDTLPGSVTIGPHKQTSTGEGLSTTNVVSGGTFDPIWVEDGENEGKLRKLLNSDGRLSEPGDPPLTEVIEPSKADILINPTWDSNPVVDWRVVKIRLETDTEIDNVRVDVIKDGNPTPFFTFKVGTMLANVVTELDLRATPDNAHADAFADGSVYTLTAASPDGDVRLKGSIANSLPFFEVDYYPFIDVIVDPDLRKQRRIITPPITQLGYQGAIANGEEAPQGWTDVSTGATIVEAIDDPNDGLRSLKILDDASDGFAAINRVLAASNFQNLHDFGGQINTRIQCIQDSLDMGVVGGLGFSGGNDPGYKGGVAGRWMLNYWLGNGGRQIVDPEGGTVFQTETINGYVTTQIAIKPASMISDLYIDGVFNQAVNFGANASNSSWHDVYRFSSGSSSAVDREGYLRESLLTIFDSDENINLTKDDITSNSLIVFPQNVFRDWVVNFPDEEWERGSSVVIEMPNNGTVQLLRTGENITFNGQESLKFTGGGFVTCTQTNLDDAAPDTKFSVSAAGDVTEVAVTVTAADVTVGATPRLTTVALNTLLLDGTEQQIKFDPVLFADDLWNNAGTIYYWDTSSWVDASVTPRLANYGGNEVHIQTSTPTTDNVDVNAYWVNPTTQVVNAWNGASWVLNGDQNIANLLNGRRLYTGATAPNNGTTRSIGLSVTQAGTVLANQRAYLSGNMTLYVDKTGGAAEFAVWIEKKPDGGVWAPVGTMVKPQVVVDGGQVIAIDGSIDVDAGDEVRIMVKKLVGDISFVSQFETLGGQTLIEPSVALSVFKATKLD